MNWLRDSEFGRRWLLAAAFTRSQGANDLFQFPVKQRVVFLPADEVGGHAAGDFRLLAALVVRTEEETVRIEAEWAGRGLNDVGNPNSGGRRLSLAGS
jgi:hypothetical protein